MSNLVKTNAALNLSHLAGKPAPKDMLVDVRRLEREYFERRPDLHDRNQLVSFGTSGHRGSPLTGVAARPSGTENIYKIYAESFNSQQHLDAIVGEAQRIVNAALNSKGQA
jgi:phosphoglucomutase